MLNKLSPPARFVRGPRRPPRGGPGPGRRVVDMSLEGHQLPSKKRSLRKGDSLVPGGVL